VEYYKKDKFGTSLIPGRHNIVKYIADMDKRNKEIFSSKARATSNIVTGTILDNKNQLWTDVDFHGSTEKYRKGWEVIYGENQK